MFEKLSTTRSNLNQQQQQTMQYKTMKITHKHVEKNPNIYGLDMSKGIE